MEIAVSAMGMEGTVDGLPKRGLMAFDQFTRLAADIGYHGICMRASLAGVDTPRAERLELKRKLDKLCLISTMVTTDFDVPLNNIRGPLAMREIGPHLDVADDFDSKLLRVCIKSWADLKWVQRAADEALERGITLTHMAHCQSMFETVDGAIEYTRRVNRRNFSLTYESTNWAWGHHNVGRETIKRIAPYLCYVYVKNTKAWEGGKKRMMRWDIGGSPFDDAYLDDPGTTIDFKEILEALEEIGYDGAVAVHQGPLEGESIEHCYRSSYEYLTKIGKFARRASATPQAPRR